MKTSTITKRFFLILFTIASSLFAQAQAEWQPLYPLPTGNDLEDVCFVDEMNGWAVGVKGSILYTNDGGESWEFQESGTELTFLSVFFIDTLNGWIVGSDVNYSGAYIILNTNDGGNQWTMQDFDSTCCLRDVFFTDPENGWAVGDHNTIFHTGDAGNTWDLQLSVSGYWDLWEVFFTDQMNGWVTSSNGLLKTTDGGLNWDEQIEGRFESIYFINENEGWASIEGIGYGYGKILHTTDAFSSWDTISDTYCMGFGSCGYFSLFFKDSNNGWLLHYICGGGCSSDLYKTTDGGNTWMIIGLPGIHGFHHISFSPQGKGCIVGDHGIIYTSKNWEDEWIARSQCNMGFNFIQFTDHLNGWAAGSSYYSQYGSSGSSLLHTTDGGLFWEKLNNPIAGPIESMSLINNNSMWAVGNSIINHKDTAVIIHTTNQGEDWQVQLQEADYSLYDIIFINETTGWAVGGYQDEGRILKTIDGGATWELQSCDTCQRLNAVTFIDPDHGWTVGTSIYATTDGGQNWLEQLYDTSGFFLKSVHFLDTQEGWIVGIKNGEGIILHTINGGENWSYELRDKYFYSVHFKDNETGLIAASEGTILFTQDGGTTWEEQSSGTDNILYSVFYSDEGQGYAAGGFGTIVKSDLLTSFVEDNQPLIQNSEFKIQNYPNPTRGVSSFKFQVSGSCHVTLKIYDMQGREIATIVDEKLPTGEHQITWNAEGMTAGIYYIKLMEGDQTTTGKMILMK